MTRKRFVLALTLFSLTLLGAGVLFRNELRLDRAKEVTTHADGPANLLAKWTAATPDERRDLAATLVPLLDDPDPDVRKAAVLALGPAGPDEPAVSDEALFRLLSDADLNIRAVTAAALGTRGLDDHQIALARKLAHRDPAERLALLFDLRWAGDTIKDPGPWLARLAKDPDPAVRAGAARAAHECRVTSADWLHDLADRDPDPLVRRVAAHYRPNPDGVRQAGGVE